MFSHLKEHLQGEQSESGDRHCSLHCLSEDEYRGAVDRLPQDGESVWTVLVMTLSGGYMCKHSRILVVFLSCVLLLQ